MFYNLHSSWSDNDVQLFWMVFKVILQPLFLYCIFECSLKKLWVLKGYTFLINSLAIFGILVSGTHRFCLFMNLWTIKKKINSDSYRQDFDFATRFWNTSFGWILNSASPWVQDEFKQTITNVLSRRTQYINPTGH